MALQLEENLQKSIDLIRSKVVEMGHLAESALQYSLRAMVENNRTLAYSVILRDLYIDEAEKELDRLCLEFLVRQLPVAGHLRFVYAVIKINNELERIGDYAESIARHFLKISLLNYQPSYAKYVEIADLAIPMLHDALQAFLNQDADLARKTMDKEDVVDDIRNRIHADLVVLREEDKLPSEALAPLTIIASRFERVADQACNICEEVLYISTGEYHKHRGTEVFRVLFVGNGNSSRSQMAEGIGNALGLSKFVFSSAGMIPGTVDSRTITFLQEKGINISRHFTKPISQIPNLDHYQVIVALSKEAEQAFPPAPTKTVAISWEVEDPSLVQGPPQLAQQAYEKTFQFIDTNIRNLVEAILGDE
ncbi:MAG: phosphate signaling complex protein PhoU, partial [candidate division KSB1 bacterium]